MKNLRSGLDTVPAVLRAQVATTPDAMAVVCGDERLTFGQLQARANQLAHRLVELGAGPETLVGVCLPRSVDMLVAILGVLTAGAGYLPVDPDYPRERRDFMLADSGIKLVVTDQSVGLAADVPALWIDDPSVREAPRTPPEVELSPENLAYVIYTSGSTGRPKGAEVTHGSLTSFWAELRNAVDEPQLWGPGAIAGLTSSFSFDASVKQLGLWSSGACLHILDDVVRRDPRELLDYARRHRLTSINCVAGFVTALIDAGLFEQDLDLRTVLSGGEAINSDLWARMASNNRIAFYNSYGTAECTVNTTVSLVDGSVPTIGLPIGDARLYVVDEYGELVPDGTPGELLIGGAGVARGYRGRPGLTAQRFVPDRFSGRISERLYRTGDLVSRRPSGELDFVGRVDGQVKIRGYRVEPAEIEEALRAHPDIADVAVIAREDVRGDQRLVGYLVPIGDLSGTVEDSSDAWQNIFDLAAYLGAGSKPALVPRIRSYAQEILPEYLVPSVFVVLPSLPLSVNGKIDRQALPAPMTGRANLQTEFVAPRDEVEEVLAKIWSQLLGIDQVGVHDDFFELGGHSLLATQLVIRVRDVLSLEVPVQAVFEASSIAGLAATLREAAGTDAGAVRLVPVDRSGPLPLSAAQRRLWFLNRLVPDNPFYNIPAAIRLTGRIDVQALTAAFSEIVRRHEMLRTTFSTVDGEPSQYVRQPESVDIDELDVSADADPVGRAVEIVADAARRSFDLEKGPLLRVSLIRLGPADHVLNLVMHHIVSDGWSTGVLLRELAELYRAFVVGQSIRLAEPAIQYGDFADWQERWLASGPQDEQVRYWRTQLTGAPTVLDLPADRRRPVMPSYQGGTYSFEVDRETVNQLRALSQDNGVSMFMTLLAAFNVLLSRYGDAQDLLVGVPIAGRVRPELERLIGFFINTLAIRTDLTDDPTFVALLARVREATLGAYANQDLPFERLVEDLAPERDLSRNPLVQVMFQFINLPRDPLLLDGLTIEQFGLVGGETVRFDLECHLNDVAGRMGGSFVYSTDLFEPATIERMVSQFLALLAAAVADPHRPVSRLSLTSENEYRQLVDGWNATEVELPEPVSIPELFASQVRKDPDAMAVRCGDESLTFGELDARAERVAARLGRLGVRPEVLVAVSLPRSVDLLVSLLGIVKAGGGYLPVDPDYPLRRREFMLSDSSASLLVTSRALGAVGEVPAVYVEDFATDTADVLPLGRQKLLPDQLAYVNYTSGSTGRPKGTQISHRAVIRLVTGMPAEAALGPDSVVLHASSVSFDASTFEIWGSLLNGATCVVFPGRVLTGPDVKELVKRHGVDTAFLTTALFNQFVDVHPDALREVKVVLFGGESVSIAHVRQALETLPDTQLIHCYGPTETTTFATCYPVPATMAADANSVPIGRPIGNTRLYVLDDIGHPVPMGVPGELFVGGAGVGTGYVNRPGLSAQRFVPDPFAANGQRMYRTGDIVRYRPSGDLVFLSRKDKQLKIRGFRVEPGEIEAALLTHVDLDQAMVVAREDVPGDKRLVAYVVSENAPTPSALREFLRQRLPEYLVPSIFVTLPELPLTQSGKVDQAALPAPEVGRSSVGSAFVAPRNPTEEVLAGCWEEVLGVERVGVEDNFFDLGGHSLLGTRVVSRVQSALGVDLPLRALFEAPTVAGLATVVRELSGATVPDTPDALVRAERAGDIPLSHAQQRLWFLDQLVPGSPFYNIPSASRVRGELDVSALQAALDEVVRRHEMLRTVFVTFEGEPLQRLRPAGSVDLELIDVSNDSDPLERAGELADRAATRPFDLSSGPLLRVLVAQIGRADHLLCVVMHHIVSDGWSTAVFWREVSELYGDHRAGRASALPELPVQYGDFALWQRRWLDGGVLPAQIEYWRSRLAGAPPALELPADRPRPPMSSHRGESCSFSIPVDVANRLRALSRTHGVTDFMFLLAVLDILLSRYGNTKDVSVGVPMAGRTRPELEPLIGFFVNTLVMRTDLDGDPTFVELLGRVRETTLGAYANQDLPFEQLVEELAPERDLSRNPLVQVLFQLINVPLQGLTLDGAEVEAFGRAGVQSAKFDLECQFTEVDGELTGSLIYSLDLFDGSTAARMVRHFQRLLAEVVADPTRRLSGLELLDADERHESVVAHNKAAVDLGDPAGLHELVERQVARTPGAPAVSFEDTVLTYAELDARAGRLAGRLQDCGIGSECVVGVYCERSVDLVVALLGILKAGAAFLPLNPEDPADRTRDLVADSGPVAIVASSWLRPPDMPVPVVEVDLLDDALPPAPSKQVDPEAMAYVLFTSGSTGKPNAAVNTHRGIVNRLRWMQAEFGLDTDDAVLQKTPMTFDVCVWEFFWPLITGARLVIARPGGHRDPRYLAQLIAEEKITTVHFVPSMLRVFLQEPTATAATGVRRVLCSGEALEPVLQEQCQRLLPADLYNLYGPAEAAIDVTSWKCERGPRADTVPIGRPIANIQTYVLDDNQHPVPLGVAGELYLGGAGLARGYLGRPGLTARRFVPHPFTSERGQRLYRTGDLVRQRESGELEFLGRRDSQVKIRGFRVELGEIESVLSGHPAVRQAVIIAREDIPGDKRLVAYLVADRQSARELVTAELRAYVRERLPDYMVPSVFVVLTEFPLSANGKIDRRALPTPEVGRAGLESEYVAPRNTTEALLAQAWADVLGLDEVGVEDNFFELGGHSLLVPQLVAQIREDLSVQLPVKTIFEAPTPAATAQIVTSSAEE
jgi:amino acid adenylation domain-containing protein